MSKKASETRGTAKCASCLFGRPVTVVDKDKSGKETARREMCECHVALSTAATSGYRSTAATSGNLSTAATSGNLATAEVHGRESVAVVTGLDSKAQGCVGSWLVLTERDENWHILGIKAICIDGKKYYADTWYTLKGGCVVRAEP